MQVNHIEIDNNLIDHAVKLSGLNDRKKLIEKALLFFTQQQIKTQQQDAEQKIINDFYDLPISELESLATKSVYQGKALSLEDMEQAIEYEAGLHQ